MYMKLRTSFTISSELLRKIDRLRGREKRSTFVEYLLRLGLKEYIKEPEAQGQHEQHS